MDVSPCSTASHSLCWEGNRKLKFLYEIWDLLLAEMTHCGPLGAHICYQKLFQPSLHIWGRLWNTSSTIDTSPCSTRAHCMCWKGAQNLKFAWNLMFVIGTNDMLCTIGDSFRLLVALPTICIHPREVMKHFINNIYLSSQHDITFPVLRGCSKSQICMKFDVCYWQKWHVMYHKGLIYAIRSSSNHPNTFKE